MGSRSVVVIVALLLLVAGAPWHPADAGATARRAKQDSAPVITSIQPAKASAGTGSVVTIRGSGFGSQIGSARIDFTYKPAHEEIAAQYIPAGKIVSWSDTEIVCAVPADQKGYPRSAASGPLRVVTSSGAKSKACAFKVSFGYLRRWQKPVYKFVVSTDNRDWR
jgi:hypothetical protein